jgi:hypothetical protein
VVWWHTDTSNRSVYPISVARKGDREGKEQPGIRPVASILMRSEIAGSTANIFNVSLAL